jgi:hypothetical protein
MLLGNYLWFGFFLVLVVLVAASCGRAELLPGDEAPIRVKGGSIHLELLNATRTWKKNGSDPRKWKMSGGTRTHVDYKLTFATEQAACSVTAERKTTVRVTYSDNHWIEFTGQGNHTTVTSDVGLQTSPDERTLSYLVSGGYMSAIHLDGRLACAFASPGEFTSLDAED